MSAFSANFHFWVNCSFNTNKLNHLKCNEVSASRDKSEGQRAEKNKCGPDRQEERGRTMAVYCSWPEFIKGWRSDTLLFVLLSFSRNINHLRSSSDACRWWCMSLRVISFFCFPFTVSWSVSISQHQCHQMPDLKNRVSCVYKADTKCWICYLSVDNMICNGDLIYLALSFTYTKTTF